MKGKETKTKENDMKVFHGSNNIAEVLKGIAAVRQGDVSGIRGDFHVAFKQAVSHNYGKHVAFISLAGDVVGAHQGQINKDGNQNAAVGNELEMVMKSPASKVDFAEKIVAIDVLCPDGRVAKIDVDSGSIASIA